MKNSLNARLNKMEEVTLTMEWQMGLISFEDAFFALIKKQFSLMLEMYIHHTMETLIHWIQRKVVMLVLHSN